MLSYDVIHKKYNFISDILTEAGSDLKLKGRPNFISYLRTLSNPIVGNSADPIAIATNSIGVLVEPDGLVYRPAYDFSIFTQTATNAAIGQGGLMECKNFVTFLRSNGDVYTYDYGRMYPINKMSGASKTFKASRYVSHNPGTPVNYTSILFNEQTSEFVWYPADGNQVCYPLSNGTLFSNKINKNLLYMKYVNYNGGENFAILKDKTGGKVYLARFTSGQQRSFKEITGTPLAQAENFEISDIYGYIFYSIGGKLFEYDFNLDLNKQMLDYGTRKISLLKFQYIPNTNDPEKKRYLDITRRLVVCTYDPADLNTSGAMDIYSIPPINAPLVKEESYSGMGKIVSIDYRDR
ncbi:Uncharacterised protein [Sphingobacterium spiritivorum]|uniref:Uncharacterized protein n=2 Tax=Sphingobacterium spiritivorum TaxID=258 RepID=A0A380CSU2_SPHSI|nr:Uncharacterised protein [Sphingobacterium spiritivorum]